MRKREREVEVEMCEKDEKKEGSVEREYLWRTRGNNFHLAFRSTVANNRPKEREGGTKRSDQFNTYIMHTFPLLRSGDSSVRSAIGAQCTLGKTLSRGQWLSTDYGLFRSKLLAEVIRENRAQSKLPFYTAWNANYTTSEAHVERLLKTRN